MAQNTLVYKKIHTKINKLNTVYACPVKLMKLFRTRTNFPSAYFRLSRVSVVHQLSQWTCSPSNVQSWSHKSFWKKSQVLSTRWTFHGSVSPLHTNVQCVYFTIKSAIIQCPGMWSIIGKCCFTVAIEGASSNAFLTYAAALHDFQTIMALRSFREVCSHMSSITHITYFNFFLISYLT